MKTNTDQLKRFFENEPHLGQFGGDAHALYSLSLYCDIDDLEVLKDRHCTDGPDDKSCDYCVIQPETKNVAIVQAYYDVSWKKAAAPSKKASDLGQALSWLLVMDIDSLPSRLKPYADELRSAISSGEIDSIQLLYVHNCPESQNVEEELRAVASSTAELVRRLTEHPVTVSFEELGLTKTTDLHESSTQIISVRERIELEGSFGLVTEGASWRSIQGVISGEELSTLYRRFGSKLFSANVREYLGSRNDSRNINNGIKQTAEGEPHNFYPFNNGLTILTRSFAEESGMLVCDCLSIVNGAQTTGALSSLDSLSSDLKVLCRIIECDNEALIAKIVKYNNTQNAVRASDRKSNDPVHRRLEEELRALGFSYRRRRGQEPPGIALHIDPVAQCLASFHDELNLATRDRRDIFEVENKHSKIFNEEVSARHVLLVEAFNRAIGKRKAELKAKDSRTDAERKQLDFLTYTAGKLFLLAVIGGILGELVGHSLESRFEAKLSAPFATKDGMADAVEACLKIVAIVLPLVVRETDGENYYTVVRSEKRLKEVIVGIEGVIAAISNSIEPDLIGFRNILQA